MRRKNFLPIIIFFCGLIFIFAFCEFIFFPTQSEILKIKTETQQLQITLQELNELERQHENLSEFAEKNAENLQELKLLLPSAPSQETFSAELYKTAEKNKISVTSLQVGESIQTDEEKLQSQSVKIKLEGNYISLLNFIREIEDGERFAKPKNISLESGEANLIFCEIEFLIFNMKD